MTLLAQHVEGELPASIELQLRPVAGSSNHARARAFGEAVGIYRSQAGPDVVIGFDKLPGLDLYFAGDRCYVERVHATRSRLSRLTPRYRTFRRLEDAVFRRGLSTRILLLRESQQDVFQTWYDTESERFEVLPPGVHRTRTRPPDADERRLEMRERLGINTSDPVMLFVGSDYARKGLDRAVEALGHLQKMEGQSPWLIAAGAGDPSPFVQRAKAAGTHQRFLALGPRDDILDLMLAADVLVHPARTEAGGVVLLEAIVAGTPVIASSVCGYGPIVTDAGAGVLIPESDDEQDFQSNLNEALEGALVSPIHGTGPEDTVRRWRANALRYTASHPELFLMHAHIVRAIELAAGEQAVSR